MIAISHPTGNQNFRNAAFAFQCAGKLTQLYTSIAWNDASPISCFLPGGLRTQLNRRHFDGIPREKITSFPCKETGRLLSSHFKIGGLTTHEKGMFSVDSIYHYHDSKTASDLVRRPVSSVYAYEDGALNTFNAAKRLGMRTMFEQPIGYWRSAREILGEEAEHEPGWAGTLTGNRDSAGKLERKDEELSLADKIFVASSFTAQTLTEFGVDTSRIVTIPYGGPVPVAPEFIVRPQKNENRPLRVLFVGGLSQRKGLSYLFEAANLLSGKISLTVIGSRVAPCKALDSALLKCRYIPSLPHSEVLSEMDRHDVFVFPSLFEGFGLVILEAMSRGLPVIATPHTAGPDIISEGKDGYIVPIRNAEIIAEKLEMLADDPELLYAMKIASLKTANHFTWQRYQESLMKNVND